MHLVKLFRIKKISTLIHQTIVRTTWAWALHKQSRTIHLSCSVLRWVPRIQCHIACTSDDGIYDSAYVCVLYLRGNQIHGEASFACIHHISGPSPLSDIDFLHNTKRYVWYTESGLGPSPWSRTLFLAFPLFFDLSCLRFRGSTFLSFLSKTRYQSPLSADFFHWILFFDRAPHLAHFGNRQVRHSVITFWSLFFCSNSCLGFVTPHLLHRSISLALLQCKWQRTTTPQQTIHIQISIHAFDWRSIVQGFIWSIYS